MADTVKMRKCPRCGYNLLHQDLLRCPRCNMNLLERCLDCAGCSPSLWERKDEPCPEEKKK